MRQSNRLVVNTLATFARMSITVGIGLLTTRLLLEALGDTDFGTLGVIAATHFISSLVCASLLTSAQRNLSFEIAKADSSRISAAFSTSLVASALATVVLMIIGISLSWTIVHGLKIPDARLDAAWWTYFSTLAGVAVTAFMIPYQSVIVAHQELAVSGAIDVLSAVVRIAVALMVLATPIDHLKAFALLNLASQVFVALILALLARARYPSVRFNWSAIQKGQLRNLSIFTGWTTAGFMAWSLRQNGSAILVNLRFGAASNAGFSIALQIATYAGNLASAITRAVQPALTRMVALGNTDGTRQLTCLTSKYVVILLSFVLGPLLIDTPAILAAWLKTVPADAIVLVRVSIAWMLLGALRNGHDLAAQATGNLKSYSLATLCLSSAGIVASAAALFIWDAPIWSVPLTIVAVETLQILASSAISGRAISLPGSTWLKKSVVPIVTVISISMAATLAFRLLTNPTTPIWSFLVYGIICIIATWSIGTDQAERDHFVRIIFEGTSRSSTRKRT